MVEDGMMKLLLRFVDGCMVEMVMMMDFCDDCVVGCVLL